MIKVLLVARKNLAEVWREPVLLVLTLAFPLLMLLVCLAYGTAPKPPTQPILILDQTPAGAPAASQAQKLLEAIRQQRLPDGRPAFEVQPAAGRTQADAALKQGTAVVLLSLSSAADGSLALAVLGDATSLRFITASSLLDSVTVPFLDALAGKPQVVTYQPQPLAARGPVSDFDAYVPGMIVMAILMLIPQTATLLSRELRQGTLRRLRLTPLHAWELLGGVSLAQMVVAVLQVVITFLAALALGFRNQGSLLLAVVIGLLFSLSAIGQGLIVACFSHNDSDAINFGATVSMFQVFLSGAFFAFPTPALFRLAGHEIGVLDVLAATHGMNALQLVLSGGAGLGEVAFRLGAMAVLSLIYFILGVIFFQRTQMRAAGKVSPGVDEFLILAW